MKRRETWLLVGSFALAFGIAIWLALKFANPAPPRHLVIATSESEGNQQAFAQAYHDVLKDEGIDLEIRKTSGGLENLKLLQDPNSNVEAAFTNDGLGTVSEEPDVSSLGSLCYEPLWIFYRGAKKWDRLSDLKGKRIAIGPEGSGTRNLALKLLKSNGIDASNTTLADTVWLGSIVALEQGDLDAAFFVATPEEPEIKALLAHPKIRLMSLDQAEAITRQVPFLHHLVLPHGAIDLARNLPSEDTHLVSTTATLLVKDSLHPALSYLLLKAISQTHDDPAIFEKKGEFPINKDYEFPLSEEATTFYKSGTPFWHRYLPFWLATLIARFIFVALPILAILIPTLKLIPRFLTWRARLKIYQRYGELKHLETEIRKDAQGAHRAEYLKRLDQIEDRVNHLRVPLAFSDLFYGLRGHIDFVRTKILAASRN